MTPAEVIDAVARGDAVATDAYENHEVFYDLRESSPQLLEDYLRVNAELWRQLAIWFELRKPNGD